MREVDRRRLLRGFSAACGGASLVAALPRWAQSATSGGIKPTSVIQGQDVQLAISRAHVIVDGRPVHAATVNGTAPGPLLRFKEGQTVRVAVRNELDEETSLHWHGVLVPFQMDGVPGVSFPGIKPQETFVYELPIRQAGTYWYHSHSGMQEAEGLYGPIVIEPMGPDPVLYDRDHVIVLADFPSMHPHLLFKRMKQDPGLFNYQKQTFTGLMRGQGQTLQERLQWGAMRMDPTDISDVTGAVTTFVINGHAPRDAWTGLFRPGERVRLRFINAAAQTLFNVRIPGLRLTVVAADGQNVRPVEVDEFQIGNAETYDVIVQPREATAYALVAEAVDRSGMALGVLASRPGMTVEAPALRPRPLDTMKDMGMAGMTGMSTALGASRMAMGAQTPPAAMPGMTMTAGAGTGAGDPSEPRVAIGPEVQTLAQMPADRTGEPGQGLADVGHKVLVYQDLLALTARAPPQTPSRTLKIRLTGNMERFIWGIDGHKFSDAPTPYSFSHGERVRVVLINDTMMAHPMHLHGHFFDLVHGPAESRPKKHTVVVAPGGTVTWDFTAEPGDWAFHCHMLYHMHAGMFQVFSVRPIESRIT